MPEAHSGPFDGTGSHDRTHTAAPAGLRLGRTLLTAGGVAALIGAAVLPGLLASPPSHAQATANAAVDKDPSRLTVTVISAARSKPIVDLALPGTMLPIQETPIYARTNGYVKRFMFDMGAHVKAGALLAEIETPEIDRELKQAIANLEQARANRELARTTAERWKAVLKDNAVAPQEVDEKVGAYEARKADVAAAEANVQRLRELKQFERVVAPFDGTITLRSIEVGQLVGAGNPDPTRLMFKLAKTDTLRLFVNVPQSHVRLVQVGQPVEIVLREYPDHPFAAKVVRTAGALDPLSKTMLTEVQVPNDKGELVAGMYAQVRFALQQSSPAIVIPANTLIVRPDGPQVATVHDGAVHFRKIKLGRDFGQTIEVISGLQEKELIVTNPSDSIVEGVAVKTVMAPPPPAPPPAGGKPGGDGKPAGSPSDAKPPVKTSAMDAPGAGGTPPAAKNSERAAK